MNTKNKKRELAWLIFLAVVCAILFSTSSVMVAWLKISFTAGSQLMVRAGIALVVCLLVMLYTERNSKNKFNFGVLQKYDKRIAIPVFLFRAGFNYCFIMALTSENATLAILILLFVKMVTNIAIGSIREKKLPHWIDMIGYLTVTAGIVVYAWGNSGLLDVVLLWAVASGFLEALRLEFIGVLDPTSEDKPKFAVFEFAGMLIVVSVLFYLSGETFLNTSVATVDIRSYWAMCLAVLAVVINKIDYDLSNSAVLSKSTYSAILATEIGFAGVLNHLVLGSAFGPQQILGLFISVVAIVVMGVATAIRKKEIDLEKRRREILLEG